MGKADNTKDYPGERDSDNSVKEALKISDKSKKYRVIFRQNRKFEMNIGRETFIFMPNEVKIMDEKIVNHPDFKKKYFVVREVK